MKSNPLVSFVGPIYNKAAWVADSIRSLQEQTLKDIEILFVDDGSTDDTVEVIEHFRKDDDRIRIHRLKKNVGLGKAWNIATKLVQSPILSIISGDDIWVPDRAKKTYEFFKRNPRKDVFYGAFWYCDFAMNKMEFKKALPCDLEEISKTLRGHYPNQYIGHFVMSLTKKMALKVPYRSDHTVGVDWPFLKDLGKARARFGYTKEVLGYARVLSTSVTHTRQEEISEANKAV